MADSDNSHAPDDDADELKRVLDETFGIWPDFEVPARDDWDRFDFDGNRLPETDEVNPPDRGDSACEGGLRVESQRGGGDQASAGVHVI